MRSPDHASVAYRPWHRVAWVSISISLCLVDFLRDRPISREWPGNNRVFPDSPRSIGVGMVPQGFLAVHIWPCWIRRLDGPAGRVGALSVGLRRMPARASVHTEEAGTAAIFCAGLQKHRLSAVKHDSWPPPGACRRLFP
jgi:hypothetical protein